MDLGRILNDSGTQTPVTEPKLRVGKWTEEEEQYAAALVKHFVAGALPIATGTSLRSFLAKKLRCSAMRVSTKLSMDTLGPMKIPKKLGQKRFFPMEGLTEAQRQHVIHELKYLESSFLMKENLEELEDDEMPTAAEPSSAHSSDEENDGPMRVGSWSEEEQVYACALIDAFLRGLVNATEGTTLRAFLAERLCCNPMRISKKLATGKMAATTLPKRLGSATYRHHTRAPYSEVAHLEYQLEQLRARCFSSASKYSYRAPHHTHTPHYAPPVHQHRLPSPIPAQESLSPLSSGIKRKLPSIALPTQSYLPPLPQGVQKKARSPQPAGGVRLY